MAHIRGTGAGGRPSADVIENVWMLCKFHHDLYDGRSHAGLKRAIGDLAVEIVRRRESGLHIDGGDE